jgi:hypothetical protein
MGIPFNAIMGGMAARANALASRTCTRAHGQDQIVRFQSI